EDRFVQMGARLKVHNDFTRRRGTAVGLPIVLDVQQDNKGEFFEVALLSRPPARVSVVDIRPADRHLLLGTRTEIIIPAAVFLREYRQTIFPASVAFPLEPRFPSLPGQTSGFLCDRPG